MVCTGKTKPCVGSALASRMLVKGADFDSWDTAGKVVGGGVAGFAPLVAAKTLAGTKYFQRSPLRSALFAYGGEPGFYADPRVEKLRVHGVPLRNYLGQMGIGLYSNAQFAPFSAFNGPMFMPPGKANNILPYASKHPGGGILLGFNKDAPGRLIRDIAGHELGHAVRSARGLFRPRVYGGSKLVSSLLGTIGTMRATWGKEMSPTEATMWSAGTALSALPMLNEEFQASRAGGKLMGLRGIRRLGTFRGLPSYAVTAAAPFLAYGIRRLFNKYGKGR